uniref:Uncharacterized protein n=1 Tax=Anopheles albimanus TaxID=7167 RepID=A0A182FYX0_ANOAL
MPAFREEHRLYGIPGKVAQEPEIPEVLGGADAKPPNLVHYVLE